MDSIGAMLGAIDNFIRGFIRGIVDGVRQLTEGPLQGTIFYLVLTLTGIAVVLGAIWSRVDKWIGQAERVLVVVVTLGMTALVFNTYLIEQASVFDKWTTTSAPQVEEPSAEPEPEGEPTPETGSAPPPAPSPAEVTATPGMVRILLTGDADKAVLIDGSGATTPLPAEVAPGTYTASATFPGYDEALEAGEFDLDEPGLIELMCDSFAESCRTRAPTAAALEAAATAPEPAPVADPLAVSEGMVRILLTGDSEEAVLIDESGATTPLPAEVAPGTYTASATFPGYDEALEAGEFDLDEPGLIELMCDSFAESCRTRAPTSAALDAAKAAASAPPPEPESDPLAVSEGMVRILLTGDANEVVLTDESGTPIPLPAEVAPGTYTASATFPGYDEALEAGEFDLDELGLIELMCDSFAESCRTRTPTQATLDTLKAPPVAPRAAPEPEPATEAPPADPIRVEIRGGGKNHRAVGLETIELPGLVPPGNFIVQADFGDTEGRTAGSLSLSDGDSTVTLRCSDRTWQCLPDSGWWNPWKGEGQMNFALMLMVALGFLGASVATQDRNHLSVDAVDRVLSPAPARLVRRLTSFAAAGFTLMMASATWDLITSPKGSGDTFPGAKVWWWLVEPINLLTRIMPGDSFGPGGTYPSRSAWETAMIEQGLEWPYGTAYQTVGVGSAFPLWLPLLILFVTFLVMGVRFAIFALNPPAPEPDFLPKKPKPGTRKPADVILAGAFPGALITLGLAVWLGQGWMIILASLLLVFMGAPLFIGVGVGTLAGWMLIQETSAESLVKDMFEATKKQEIIAIPFFVLAGNLMTHGSIARRLIDFARAIVGPLPGGLGVAGVVACAIFAAISGSSPATVIAIGTILFPMLVKQGYSEKFGLGLLTTSGGLGIIIPPSVPMIIFAVMVSNPGGIVGIVSPTELFLGGFAPGLLVAGALIAYTLYVNWPRPGQEGGPLKPGEDPDDSLTGNYGKDLRVTFVRGIASLMLPILVLGGIYGHMFGSPFTLDVTQAAAFAVVYALVVELAIHRELKITEVPKVCIETATMIGSLFLILVIAISLNKLLAGLQVPQMAAEGLLAWADDPLTFLLLVNIFLLLLGTVMDIVSAILIVAPLLTPIAAQYGIHPIHFGIMFIVNLELGYLTPPMGINLFVASTTFKRNVVKVIQGVFPFLILMLVCLMAIIWVPRWFHSAIGPIPGLPALIETQLGSITVDGPRTAREIGGRARIDMHELRQCAPAELNQRGRGLFGFTVTAEGEVTSVEILEDSLPGTGTARCLSRALQGMTFEPLEAPQAADTQVQLPIHYIP